MDIHSWLIFSSIALVATITPGPAVLLVSTHSISYGPNRAIITILGNISGLFIMSLLSVLGLGAMVLCSGTAFSMVKLFGALYLIYLGLKLWKNGFGHNKKTLTTAHEHRSSSRRLYLHGLMVALSNPKAIVFTTALFPHFIDQQHTLIPQFSILVITFMLYSFLCLYCYARLSSSGRKSIRNSSLEKLLSRLFASLFIGSGIGLTTIS